MNDFDRNMKLDGERNANETCKVGYNQLRSKTFGRRSIDRRGTIGSVHLGNGQPLHSFGPLLGVGAGARVCGETGPVQRLQADLGAEQVSDGLQGAAGVRRQRGVSQQVWDQTVGFSHHSNVHNHAGARRLWGEDDKAIRKDTGCCI